MKGIRKTAPYVAGAQPNFADMIKINTNENPFPPSPKVQEALKNYDYDSLKRYSSLENKELKQVLADKFSLAPENFMIGNGSDEVLAFCFLAFFNSEEPVLFPDITYGFYPVWADFFKIPYKEIPLNNQFEIQLDDYMVSNGGIVIANPNAPTGHFHSPEAIEALLKANPESVVVIDEAYIDFGGTSVIPLISDYPNLVVVHTLSKGFSLAGLRIGYAMAQPELINVLESVKSSWNPYSVDSIADRLATEALKDDTYYKKIQEEIMETRDAFAKELKAISFEVLPSKANFVFTKPSGISAKELMKKLTEEHIFVRYFETERLKDYLRISIGSKKEMEKVRLTIKKIIGR